MVTWSEIFTNSPCPSHRLVLWNAIDLRVDWVPRSINKHVRGCHYQASLSAMTTRECPYTFSGMWMAYLVPTFCVSVFQIPTTFLISSILAVGTLFVKGSIPFVTTGLGRIIGWYLQCPWYLGLLEILCIAKLWVPFSYSHGFRPGSGPCSSGSGLLTIPLSRAHYLYWCWGECSLLNSRDCDWFVLPPLLATPTI